MKLTMRHLLLVTLLFVTALLAACRPVTREAAQSALPSAATAADSEMVFGAAGDIQLVECNGDTCIDADGYTYTCDAGGMCTDGDGYVYTCDANRSCQASAGTATPAEPPVADAAPVTPEVTATAAPVTNDTPETPVTGGGVTAAQIQELLKEHNRYRAQVGVPNLTWSATVAASAQEWANNLGANNKFEHGKSQYGENLYMGSGNRGGSAAVQSWGTEKANYHGEAIGEGDFSSYGHYTQMVWRTTTEVGCGSATTVDGGTVWVCRYNPAGNLSGGKPF